MYVPLEVSPVVIVKRTKVPSFRFDGPPITSALGDALTPKSSFGGYRVSLEVIPLTPATSIDEVLKDSVAVEL